jgi:hypothetical protein
MESATVVKVITDSGVKPIVQAPINIFIKEIV